MIPAGPPRVRHRGGPLVMVVTLLGAWAMLRVVWWEDPFAPPAAALGAQEVGLLAPRSLASRELLMADALFGVTIPEAAYDPVGSGLAAPGFGIGSVRAPALGRRRRLIAYDSTPELRLSGVMPGLSLPAGAARASPSAVIAATAALSAAGQEQPPFLAASRPAPGSASSPRRERWSLDAWAFYREGSGVGVPVSQGRVPIYGASQAGAILQYRLNALGGHAPRLYLRGYRALIDGGESEVAFGASLRPLPKLPVRLAAEARYTIPASGTAVVRPAAYAVSELPPLALPFGTRLEAYVQAGWVGGPDRTAFADGQASVTRDLGAVGRMSRDAVRLSLGAGVWGGAQTGAERLDVGPTARLDFRVGRVPARLSIDWRERVAGDAAPGSGVSATLSAGF